jgi:hypothetical protein
MRQAKITWQCRGVNRGNKMTKKQNVENINKIVDSLIREVNTRDCATVSAMRFAIATHPKFLDYIINTPEVEAKVERDANGEIVEIITPDNLAKLIKNRLHWNFRNLKDENGFRVFHQFSVNRETGKTRYIPPSVQSTLDVF